MTRLGRSPGFTLLEVIVALAIVGVVGVGLMTAVAAQVRTASSAADHLVAASLAEEALAQLSLYPRPQLVDHWTDRVAPLERSMGRYSTAWSSRPDPTDPDIVDLQVSVLRGQDTVTALATRLYRPAGSR